MKNTFLFLLIAFLFGIMACQGPQSSEDSSSQEPTYSLDSMNKDMSLFIGTYTRKEGHVDGKAYGIYRVEMSEEAGTLILKDSTGEIINPSFIKISPDAKHLYAVSEIAGEEVSEAWVYAYAIQADKSLKFIQKIPSGATAPCHINLDAQGEFVFVANYLGGVLSQYQRDEEGRLSLLKEIRLEGQGPHAEQDAAHLHMAYPSPDAKLLLVPDKGSDKIWLFSLEAEKALEAAEPAFIPVKAGSGPRHVVFHPEGKYLYLINELSNTISVFSYDGPSGRFEEIQNTSSLPEGYEEWNSGADIRIHPNGNFLYASNRGHNSIVRFSVDPQNGQLSKRKHISTQGAFPRNFNISPDGRYLLVANQNSDQITRFGVDAENGDLEYLGDDLLISTPVCIEFLPE